MEDVAVCPICNSTKLEIKYSSKDSRYKTDDHVFNVARCQGCGLGITTPRPEKINIGEYYPNDYYGLRGDRGGDEYRETRSFRERVERVLKISKGGKLLEVGSANGDFLDELEHHGFDVVGAEMSSDAAEYCRNNYNIEVFNQSVEEMVMSEKSLDVIAAWEVFEHLYNPLEVLAKWRLWLKPGGVIILSTPNYSSPYLVLLHRYDMPRHLFHFTPNNFHRMAKIVGLEVKYIDQHTEICDGSLKGAGTIMLRKIFKTLNLKYAVENNKVVRVLDEWLFGKLTRWLLPYLGRNGDMVVCLKRPDQY